MSESYIGQIMQFGGNFPIKNWATCDGQIMSIAQNTALFSILGTTYGGNGTTTFALPDCRGRVSLHWGTGPGLPNYVLGEVGGSPTVTLLTANLPAMPLLIPCNGTASSTNVPSGNILGAASDPNTGDAVNAYAAANTANGYLAPQIIGGQSLPVQTIPAYLCVTWLICLYGIYPPRN